MKHQFRMKVLALGVLAALGSEQVMAEAIVTSNGAAQTDRIAYDIPTNTAGMNISGNAATATTATNVSGGTASVTSLTNTGNTDLQNSIYNSTANNSGAVYVNDNLIVSGTTYTYGNSNIGAGNGAVNVIGGNTATSNTIHSVTNTIVGVDNNISGTTNTVTGTTNINTTGNAVTTMGDSTNQNSKTVIQTQGASISVWDTANTIAGTTNINTGVDAATTIGSAANISAVSAISGSSSLLVNNTSATLQYDGAGTSGGMVQVGVTSATIRASNAGALASNGTTGTMAVGQGGGYNAYTTSQTVGNNTTIGNLLNGVSYTNQINGNTFIDGNVYINGTLNYVSSNTATTTVVGTGATGNTSAGMTVVNAGQAGGVGVDANGKLTANATPTQTTSALTVTNTTTGQTHGFVVNETQAVMSGGTHSTSLTLNDNGARFSNSATGAPVTVTGVADGQQDFDAVNYRQLKQIAAGVAGVSAMANIPQVDQNKTFAIGVGLGNFQSQTALALGASYRVAQNAVIKASASTTNAERKTTVYGVGAGFSW